MSDSGALVNTFPLLDAILRQRGLAPKGIYTIRDAASIFAVSARTVQDWCREGKLSSRDLPGRGRFLSLDLEKFLENSLRKKGVMDDE